MPKRVWGYRPGRSGRPGQATGRAGRAGRGQAKRAGAGSSFINEYKEKPAQQRHRGAPLLPTAQQSQAAQTPQAGRPGSRRKHPEFRQPELKRVLLEF